MSLELLTSLIALAGVVISILASAFVSSRQSKIEVKKLRTDLQMTYVSKLIDKRLEAYPALFKPISDFEESLKYGSRQKSSADKLLKSILEWDASHVLFMSSNAIRKYVKFRKLIRTLREMPKAEFDNHVLIEENRKAIVRQIRELETALKQDLGVYVIDFPDVDKNFSSYTEVSELVHNPKKRK